MSLIRNLFALFGVIALIALGGGWLWIQDRIGGLDPEAVRIYTDMMEKVLTTGDGVEATVWRIPVEEGLTAEDVEETLKFVANEHNLSNVGELPLYKDVEAKTGKPYRFVKIYMFCNSVTAAKMLDYSDAFSAYLPCRISLVEDKQGRLWLIALNMDLMIHGGAPLPPKLKAEALQVKDYILDLMHRGATGEF